MLANVHRLYRQHDCSQEKRQAGCSVVNHVYNYRGMTALCFKYAEQHMKESLPAQC